MIEHIFPVKIYKTQYTGKLEELKSTLIPKLDSVFEKTKLNNQGSMRGGLCSYNAVRDLHSWPELSPYIDFLNKHLPIYWKELGYKKEPVIAEMWANKYSQGSFIDTHNHSPITVTASFYLQKPVDSGNICFVNPLDTLLKYQPLEDLDNRNIYHKMFNYEVDVKEGDVVMFPGWLNHETQPNNSNLDRIIIGTNVVA